MIQFAKDYQSFEEGNNPPLLKKDEPFSFSAVEESRLIETGYFESVPSKDAEKIKKQQVETLTKKSKADLVAEAKAENIEVVPDSQTKEEIATAIVNKESE